MVGEDDNGDSAAKRLLVQPVNTSRLVVARSLADAAPGETVMVDRRGQTITPGQFTAREFAAGAFMVLAGAFVGVTGGVLFASPLIGAIAAIAYWALILFKMRHFPAFRAAMAHSASYRWEEAYSAFLELERKPLLPIQRRTAQVTLAGLECLLGQPEKALDRLARAQADLSSRKGYTPLLRCQAAAIRAEALAMSGRFEEAWRTRDEMLREVAAARGPVDRQPDDVLEIFVQDTALTIATAADTPDALPPNDTLHNWARAALGRSKFGQMLVSLAWAFHRRGDDEMARHLLAEAPSRIPRSSLPKTAPRLAAWAKETAKTWGIDGL